jgi:hypothetical protein
MKLIIPLTPLDRPTSRCALPIVSVEVWTKWGWETFSFFFDTGSDYSTFPLEIAEAYGVGKYDKDSEPTPIHTAADDAFGHRGLISVRLEGKRSEWICFFTLSRKGSRSKRPSSGNTEASGEIVAPQSVSKHASTFSSWKRRQFGEQSGAIPILGRTGFLREYEARIDDQYLTITSRGFLRSTCRYVERALGYIVNMPLLWLRNFLGLEE